MSPLDEELLALRDALARDLRRLVADAPAAVPEDLRLKGIIGRMGPLLAAQAPNVDALARLDVLAPIDGPDGPEAQERFLETLVRALHVPRMVMAMGEVLRQDARSDVLRPFQQRAAEAAARAQHLARLWHLRVAGQGAGPLDDDEEDDVEL
ncbi:MAG: hypothetical protein KF878_22600 [Planctomycetes bacterium]|nr:hypothetical protein [Planctomycetota bacterium]